MKSWRLIAVVVAAAALVATFLLARGTDDTAARHVPDQLNGAPRLLAVDAHGAVVQSPDKTWGVVSRTGEVAWEVEADDFLPLLASCDTACPSAVLSADTNALSSPLAADPRPLVRGAKLPDVLNRATGGKLMLFGLRPGAGLRYSTDVDGRAEWASLRHGSLRHYPAAVGYVDWFPTSDGSAAVAATDGADGRLQQVWVDHDGWRPAGKPLRTDTGFGCTSAGGRHSVLDGRHIRTIGEGQVRLAPPTEWSNCAFTRDRVVVAAYRMTNGEALTTISVYTFDGTRIFTREYDAEYFLTADARGSTFALIGSSEAQVRGGSGELLTTLRDVRDARYAGRDELVTLSDDGEVQWIDLQSL